MQCVELASILICINELPKILVFLKNWGICDYKLAVILDDIKKLLLISLGVSVSVLMLIKSPRLELPIRVRQGHYIT